MLSENLLSLERYLWLYEKLSQQIILMLKFDLRVHGFDCIGIEAVQIKRETLSARMSSFCMLFLC